MKFGYAGEICNYKTPFTSTTLNYLNEIRTQYVKPKIYNLIAVASIINFKKVIAA